MNEEKNISETTIEALTRNFFKEANSYGFQYEHYLKFVNFLLDMALQPKEEDKVSKSQKITNNVNVNSELPIKTQRLIITKFSPDKHFSLLKQWLEDEYGRYFMLSLSSNYSLTPEELVTSGNNILGLITLTDSQPIGLMGYLNYNKIHSKAELRKIIGVPDLRGKGYGKEATLAWIQYGKNRLKLKKIYLNTIDTNIRNIKINEDLGFKVEGILRNEILIDQTYRDVLRMGLLFD
jgi:RimJ/RimL family protein N-acetyltransferase